MRSARSFLRIYKAYLYATIEPNLVTLSWPASQRWMFHQVFFFEHESAINTLLYILFRSSICIAVDLYGLVEVDLWH